MNASKNIIENAILKQLSIHHAIGEVKLFEMITHTDSAKGEGNKSFQMALGTLYRKGLIEIITDPTDTLSVIRLINVLH